MIEGIEDMSVLDPLFALLRRPSLRVASESCEDSAVPKRMLIVGVGGTLRSGSSTEATIRRVLVHAEDKGAETCMFAGEALDLPMYAPGNVSNAPGVLALIAAFRKADALRHWFGPAITVVSRDW